MAEELKYVVVESSEVDSLCWDDLLQQTPTTLRWNNGKTQAIVKYTGAKPRCLYNKLVYTNSEIKAYTDDQANGFVPEGNGYGD
jgi:hypothetical protein